MATRVNELAVVRSGMAETQKGLSTLVANRWISACTHNQVLALLDADIRGGNHHQDIRSRSQDLFNFIAATSTKPHDMMNRMPATGGPPIAPHPFVAHNFSLPPQAAYQGQTFKAASQAGIMSNPFDNSKNPQGYGASYGTAVVLASAPKPTGAQGIIICPWWSSETYQCRKHPNECKFHHADVPGGLKEPLICAFWADGNRCIRDDQNCKFAHYSAKHGQVAPMPDPKGVRKSKVCPFWANGNRCYKTSQACRFAHKRSGLAPVAPVPAPKGLKELQSAS